MSPAFSYSSKLGSELLSIVILGHTVNAGFLLTLDGGFAFGLKRSTGNGFCWTGTDFGFMFGMVELTLKRSLRMLL